MQYSDVLQEFYRLKLSDSNGDLINLHFSGAAHHYQCWLEAERVGPAQFHQDRWLAHLRHLMAVVSERANFSEARDESLRGLEHRNRWNPDWPTNDLPDPTMFSNLLPDSRYPIGIPHEFDRYLKDLTPPAFHLRLVPRKVTLRLVGRA